MQSIIKETQNLTEMLDEIIDLSKMKLGALENNPSPALIHDLITRYFAQFYGLAEKKLINYVLTLSFDKDLVLNIDVKKLERIVVNLIGNALKYTPEMGSVHLKGLYINHCLNITVSDNGPGIASDELESIFERFYRGRSTSQQSVSGLGIGLALSKDYTLTMNGSLTAESDGTHGSTFILQIPAEIAFNTKATNPDFTLEHNTKVTVGQTGKKHHLLIVEDNIEILRYLQDILRNNYTITVATDGEQAWQTLNRDHSINLVVSDAMMPKVDGFTLLQKTRNNSSLSNMPFVMLTALASEDDRLNGLRFGVDAYLTKPFGITELRLTVSRLLSQQEERKLYVAQEKGMQEDDVDQTGSRNDLIGFDKEWLEKLENIVFDNLANFQFKVPDMAILIGNSERSLFDKLKVLTGLTPSEYLKKARLNRAMELIKLKKLKTIKEITHAIGLQDARSFSAAFKEEFGRSPKDYLAGVDDNFPL
jgi:DNA-binding response OmpR family regulator